MRASQIETVNPATGLPIRKYDTFSQDQIDTTVDAVDLAYADWTTLDLAEKVRLLRVVSEEIRNNRQSLAELMVSEMGKPISEALAEADKCAWVFDYYAENGSLFLADESVETDAHRSWVSHKSMGVVFAIMPWNFPMWQVARFAAPTLLAGNTALLKHSPNVTGCALAIEELFIKAGLPKNVFRTIVVAESEVPQVVDRLLSDDRIVAVSLTGSERAGMAVGAAAGRNIKKSVLELGGSDPFVVLDDASVEVAVSAAVKSRFLNCGQSCLAAKRFIVHERIHDEFITKFSAAVEDLIVGDPTNEFTNIGPMARHDLLVDLERQVNSSISAGAKLCAGGERLAGPGAYFQPTVLADVTLDMAVMAEETFGPVAAVMSVENDEEAVMVANKTRYGLGASVWSQDETRALALGNRITSGALFVNAVVASDPRLPFGGTKKSGYGRELGAAGVKEFTNTRTYYVALGDY